MAPGAKRIVVVADLRIDKFQNGYNAAKWAQEQTLLEGSLPVRTAARPLGGAAVGPQSG